MIKATYIRLQERWRASGPADGAQGSRGTIDDAIEKAMIHAKTWQGKMEKLSVEDFNNA
jgi:hypothetical protein